MADDKVNEGAAPAFDAGAFMSELEGKVGALLDQRLPKPEAISYPYGDVRPAPRPAAKTEDDPMATLVSPYVERALKPLEEQVTQANLRAQSAEDRAAFYTAHPDLPIEVRDRVESAFTRLA